MTPPPGSLVWLSILWSIGAIAGILLSVKMGMVVLGAISGIVLAASVGLWFQSNTARCVLLVWFVLTAVLSVFLFAANGDAGYLLRVLGSAYFVYELARARAE